MLEALNQLLGFPDLQVEGYHFDQDGTLFIEVQPVFPVAVCPDCGTISDDLHDYGEPRCVRDCSVWGATCYLRWRPGASSAHTVANPLGTVHPQLF